MSRCELEKRRLIAARSTYARSGLFLDRDGIVIEDRHYISKPSEVALRSGITSLLQHARMNDWAIVVITNQSGISRGFFGWREYEAVTQRMISLLEEDSVYLDGVYANGYLPGDEQAQWRKPNPGMLFAAAKELNITLGSSILLGDRLSDLQAGCAAGARDCYYVPSPGHRAEKTGIRRWLGLEKGKTRGNTAINLIESFDEFPLDRLRSTNKA